MAVIIIPNSAMSTVVTAWPLERCSSNPAIGTGATICTMIIP